MRKQHCDAYQIGLVFAGSTAIRSIAVTRRKCSRSSTSRSSITIRRSTLRRSSWSAATEWPPRRVARLQPTGATGSPWARHSGSSLIVRSYLSISAGHELARLIHGSRAT